MSSEAYLPSTWRRLCAYFIDQIISLLFYFPFIGTVYKMIFTTDEVYLSIVELLVLFLIPAIYEFVFLIYMQRTPGKAICGLYVVPFSNVYEKLDWRHCVLRPLVGRLSFFFSWSIFALAFFRYDRTHLADWIAETRVIQTVKRAEAPTIRWFVGFILVISYAYEGLVSSSAVINSIDWGNLQVELRSALSVDEMLEIPE